MTRQSEQLTDLLDELQVQAGCPYMSDLHDRRFATAILDALSRIEEGRYPAEVWKEAAAYIAGAQPEAGDAAQAREAIEAYFSQ